MNRRIALNVLLAAAAALMIACGPSGGGGSASGPSDSEIQAAIKHDYGQIYGVDNGGARYDHMTFDFGPIERGSWTDVTDQGGIKHHSYSVKVRVSMAVYYSNNSYVNHVVRGDSKDVVPVFYFFKDSFGHWAFLNGS